MGGLRLGIDQAIDFAIFDAALRISDDDSGGAGISQHLGRDITRMGSGGDRMAVLCAEGDVGSRQDVAGAGEQCRRRADHEIGSSHGRASEMVLERSKLRERRRKAVHLPVAGDERSDRCSVHPVPPPGRPLSRPSAKPFAGHPRLAAPLLATYDAAAARGVSSIGRQRGFGNRRMEGEFGVALDTLRKGAGRLFGMILMGLLVLSFGIWGIADVFRNYGSQTLIKVGNTEITPRDYMRAQQEMLRAMSAQAGRSLSLQEARAMGLDSRVLERLIGGAAVDTHAHDLGLGVSEQALLDQIMQDPNFKDPTGNFNPAAFQQALRNIGVTEQGYLASQRETNLRRQILTTIGKAGNTPDVLVPALNRYNGETR